MSKHPKIVPITAQKPKLKEAPKAVMVATRNGSFVQISFSELLLRYFQQPQAQETAQPETSARRPSKIVYMPKHCDDSSSARLQNFLQAAKEPLPTV